MQTNGFFSSQEAKSLALSVLLAIFGGFAKLFIGRQKLSFQQLLSCLVVSGFSGVMASYLVRYGGFPGFLQNFIIGMSGFMGPSALRIFALIYEEKLGMKRVNNGEAQNHGTGQPESKHDKGGKDGSV